jgi:hypothetical protein
MMSLRDLFGPPPLPACRYLVAAVTVCGAPGRRVTLPEVGDVAVCSLHLPLVLARVREYNEMTR